ncbi:MAG: hypothetical protein ACRERV_01840 [Methylococcales bacterium]
MTELLDKAFAEASKLNETEQNCFARWLLHELESEKKWGEMFAESQDLLSQLADEALAEHRKPQPVAYRDRNEQSKLAISEPLG